ncbi:MAG: DNA-binding protein [Proteobacteria bacterium]|nr:DNA-binding protein [Pseudomonadota bacterium]
MARGGLYKSDVQKARASLLAQGKRPSVDAVRVALGNTGSKTTIHRYLKELEDEDGAGTGAKVAISDALQDLVGRLAERLHTEADAQITEAKTGFEARLKERTDALDQQTRENAALSGQLQRTEVTLAGERDAHATTLASLQDARVAASQLEERVAGLIARVAEQEAHAASIEQKHEQAREALEHFRTAAKEQRDQEHRRHEHQVQGLQVELRAAQEAVTGKNHELVQLNGEAARLTEQVGNLKKELQAAVDVGRQRKDELDALTPVRDELQVLRARWSQDLQALQDARSAAAKLRDELHLERQARADAEKKTVAGNARLTALEALFAKWDPAESMARLAGLGS